MEKQTIGGSHATSSGARAQRACLGGERQERGLLVRLETEQENAHAVLARHHTKPSALGNAIWCATEGANAVTVSASASLAGTPSEGTSIEKSDSPRNKSWRRILVYAPLERREAAQDGEKTPHAGVLDTIGAFGEGERCPEDREDAEDDGASLAISERPACACVRRRHLPSMCAKTRGRSTATSACG